MFDPYSQNLLCNVQYTRSVSLSTIVHVFVIAWLRKVDIKGFITVSKVGGVHEK